MTFAATGLKEGKPRNEKKFTYCPDFLIEGNLYKGRSGYSHLLRTGLVTIERIQTLAGVKL
ncbi:hypothetical protein B6N60_03184 [Richelia sinica FACHB-800]|uniref:Uncharacterized protein n=1 Tax=Richelia sinica FACHB-800 TaxID=1357546 RepID=A0A975Y5R1_9NOST|nr:hypothetical protein B6N60_03184 [Richelia sinica FACHB-800]